MTPGVPVREEHAGAKKLKAGSDVQVARRASSLEALMLELSRSGDPNVLAHKVNDQDHEVDADGDIPLLLVLRDVLRMSGTKFGCAMALCEATSLHS
jgi:hypothetical protein